MPLLLPIRTRRPRRHAQAHFIWVLYVRQDPPEMATFTRTIKLTLKQKNSLPSDVVEIEKNKISRSEEALPILLQLHITWTNRLSWRKPAAFNLAEEQVEESQAAINFNHLKQVVVDAEERQVRAEVPDDWLSIKNTKLETPILESLSLGMISFIIPA